MFHDTKVIIMNFLINCLIWIKAFQPDQINNIFLIKIDIIVAHSYIINKQASLGIEMIMWGK